MPACISFWCSVLFLKRRLFHGQQKHYFTLSHCSSIRICMFVSYFKANCRCHHYRFWKWWKAYYGQCVTIDKNACQVVATDAARVRVRVRRGRAFGKKERHYSFQLIYHGGNRCSCHSYRSRNRQEKIICLIQEHPTKWPRPANTADGFRNHMA